MSVNTIATCDRCAEERGAGHVIWLVSVDRQEVTLDHGVQSKHDSWKQLHLCEPCWAIVRTAFEPVSLAIPTNLAPKGPYR